MHMLENLRQEVGNLATARLTQLQVEVNRIVQTMIKFYNPEKIILYGSVVNGTVHSFSDIDLVVIKDTDKPFYERLEEIIEIAKPDVAADILVYTPEEVEKMVDDLFFQEEIVKKGQVLYSAKQVD